MLQINFYGSYLLGQVLIANSDLFSKSINFFFFSYFHLIVNYKPVMKTLLPHFNSMVAVAQPFPLLKFTFSPFAVKVILSKKQKKTNNEVEDFIVSTSEPC